MGKTYSHMIKRPVKNWNIEDRTMKQLDKIERKAPSAPRHPTSHKYIDQVAKEHPEIASQVRGSDHGDEKLLANMANLIAKPEKANEIISRRAKRVQKTDDSADDYGYEEPVKLSDGKISVKTLMAFLANNQTDPEKHNLDFLMKEHKLDKDTATRIMKYYQLFQLYTAPSREQVKEAKLQGRTLSASEVKR